MIKSMPLGDFFDQQFMFAGVFNKLELTDGENALLTAILIFNSSKYCFIHHRCHFRLKKVL